MVLAEDEVIELFAGIHFFEALASAHIHIDADGPVTLRDADLAKSREMWRTDARYHEKAAPLDYEYFQCVRLEIRKFFTDFIESVRIIQFTGFAEDNTGKDGPGDYIPEGFITAKERNRISNRFRLSGILTKIPFT